MYRNVYVRIFAILVCLIFAVAMLSSCTASTKPEESTTKKEPDVSQESSKKVMEKTTIAVYRAGSIKVAKDDEIVKEAIEKKLFQDTGLNLDFDVRALTNEDFVQKVNLALAGGEQVDAIANYIGELGLGVHISKPGLIKPLNDVIDEYGPNLKAAIPQQAWNAITYNEAIMGVPSVNHQAVWGTIIRKDWLDDLSLKVPETLDELEAVMEAFKNKGGNIIPMVGAPWCVEWTVLPGAFGINASFHFWVDPADNLLKPAFMNPAYKQVLNRMYKWVTNGWWDKDNVARPWDDQLNKFISGQSGIFMAYPYIDYAIDIVRQAKQADPNAKFELLPPIKGPEGKAGIMAMPVANSGLCIPNKSVNVKYLIGYLDWLASSADNYEIARYGIKDKHWVDVGPGMFDYPEDKREAYTKEAPYSRLYHFLEEWVSVSDRLNMSYSEQEREWIRRVREFPVITNPAEGMIIPEMPEIKDLTDELKDIMETNLKDKAQAGLLDPDKVYDEARAKYEAIAKPYYDQLNELYKKFKQ